MESTGNSLREHRRRRGFKQQDLADRVGVSRQTLIAWEHGRGSPPTAAALILARELEVPVERLFWLEQAQPRTLEAVLPGAAAAGRVVMARVAERWVAHPLAPDASGLCTAADGLIPGAPGGKARVRPLRSAEELAKNVLVAGCDPALGILAAHAGPHLRWVYAPSLAAVRLLDQNLIHVAGMHLRDEESGEFNRPVVERLLPRRHLFLVNLGTWEQGLVVASGNPLRIREAADLSRSDVRIINREPGAGARNLLDRALARARVPSARVQGYESLASGHMAVAQAVQLGAANAGVASRAAAEAFDLGFVPMAQERFDLVLDEDGASREQVGRILDVLRSRSLRRELGALRGYDASRTGLPV